MSRAAARIDRDRALGIQQRAMRDWIAMLGSAPDSGASWSRTGSRRRSFPRSRSARSRTRSTTPMPARSPTRSSGSRLPTTRRASTPGPCGRRSSTARRSPRWRRPATPSTASRWRWSSSRALRPARPRAGLRRGRRHADARRDQRRGTASPRRRDGGARSQRTPRVHAASTGPARDGLRAHDRPRRAGRGRRRRLRIYFVATREAARGRGLATRLLAAALVEARGRGCATSSLQSSAMGERIYDALGYRPWFRLHMYERRRSA